MLVSSVYGSFDNCPRVLGSPCSVLPLSQLLLGGTGVARTEM